MLDLLATPARRRVLFACLYLSEGAPIGFIWWALPTKLAAADVPVEQITTLTALLVLPWTLKFLWAPLLDVLRTGWWGRRQWIIVSQVAMGLTLLPLIWLDLSKDFELVRWLLLLHAFSAATQDVAIDALCVGSTTHEERGRINGWMQAGMLVGRAALGGGALALAASFDRLFGVAGAGETAMFVLLIGVTWFSLVLVLLSREPAGSRNDLEAEDPFDTDDAWSADEPPARRPAVERFGGALTRALLTPSTWLGLLFALTSGAAFEAVGVVVGPYMLARGATPADVGWFRFLPTVACMLGGSLLGGLLSDITGHRRAVASAMVWIIAAVVLLAWFDMHPPVGASGHVTLALLAAIYFGIGAFVASSYALFMDLTDPRLGGTQFTAFMAATNGCEAWSGLAMGAMAGAWGYPYGMFVLAGVSAAALGIVPFLKRAPDRHETADASQTHQA